MMCLNMDFFFFIHLLETSGHFCLFLAELGLCSCVGFFSSGGEQGRLELQCEGSSLQRLFLWWSMGSNVHKLQQLQLTGSRAQPQ